MVNDPINNASLADVGSYNSSSLPWQERSINFVASSNTHVIKFLPRDYDSLLQFSFSDLIGGLRMGIDDIDLNLVSNINLPIALVQQVSRQEYASCHQLELNIEGNPGVYIVKIRTEEKEESTIKLIKK